MTEKNDGAKCGSSKKPCSCKAKKDAKVIEYEHHGTKVKVREDLKGKHRENCLCFRCGVFEIGSASEELLADLQCGIRGLHNAAKARMDEGCARSALLYALCRELDMTTPVWECPEQKDPE